jgi:Holliday junction resolvase
MLSEKTAYGGNVKSSIPDQSEAEITRGIREILKQMCVWHFKVHQGLGSTPGIPDIIGIWNGRMLAIEVKTAKGKLSDKQESKIREINRAGGLAFVARSIDDVIDALDAHDMFLVCPKRKAA